MIYGYLRVSTDAQDVENQRQSFVNFGKASGVKIDRYIKDEGVSGATDFEERNLGKLLNRCKEGDTIIASEISRLGRNLFMIMRFLETCMKKGVKVKTIKDNYDLSDNIQSKVLAFAFGIAAEIERTLFLKRSQEGQKRFRQNGGIMRSVARPPKLKLDKFRDDILKLLKEGKSLANIGRCFGASRDTVERWLDYNNIEYIPKRPVCNNKQSHAATLKTLSDCRGAIEYGIMQSWTYAKIYEHVKRVYPHIKIAEKSVRRYIQNDKTLCAIWCDLRNRQRLEANLKVTWKASKKLAYERELEYVNKRIAEHDLLEHQHGN